MNLITWNKLALKVWHVLISRRLKCFLKDEQTVSRCHLMHISCFHVLECGLIKWPVFWILGNHHHHWSHIPSILSILLLHNPIWGHVRASCSKLSRNDKYKLSYGHFSLKKSVMSNNAQHSGQCGNSEYGVPMEPFFNFSTFEADLEKLTYICRALQGE